MEATEFVEVGELKGFPIYMEKSHYKTMIKNLCVGRTRTHYPPKE